MIRKLMRYSGISALALTLVLWGCDDLTEPTSPLRAPGGASEDLIVEQNHKGYTMATETDPTVGVVTAVIDEKGGWLNIGSHTLYVPKKAVDAPTTFTMTKLPGEIKVGLTATRVTPNDVGEAGFRRPLTLALSYDRAGRIPDANRLKILWVKPGGDVEVMPSRVNKKERQVEGQLKHFSDYGVGFPNYGGSGFGW